MAPPVATLPIRGRVRSVKVRAGGSAVRGAATNAAPATTLKQVFRVKNIGLTSLRCYVIAVMQCVTAYAGGHLAARSLCSTRVPKKSAIVNADLPFLNLDIYAPLFIRLVFVNLQRKACQSGCGE